MEFSEFLKRRLTELEMSYSDLERILSLYGYNVSKSTIAHWVSGRNKPPVKDHAFVLMLARALKMSVSRLWTEMGFVNRTPNETVERAVDIIENLPPDKQDLALRLLEQLAQN